MKVEGVDRVVLAVKDLEKAQKFFSDLLGIKFDQTRQNTRTKIRADYARVGSFGGLEVVEPTSEESLVDKFIRRRGEGPFMLVFKVDNLEEWKKFFEEKGIRLVDEIERGGLREAIFHPKDTYNIPFVLCEYEAAHPATCASLHKSK